MTRKEYEEILRYEIFYYFRNSNRTPTLFDMIRTKYFQPNTNCMYLARKMWYLFEKGGISRIRSKLIFLEQYFSISFLGIPLQRSMNIRSVTSEDRLYLSDKLFMIASISRLLYLLVCIHFPPLYFH